MSISYDSSMKAAAGEVIGWRRSTVKKLVVLFCAIARLLVAVGRMVPGIPRIMRWRKWWRGIR